MGNPSNEKVYLEHLQYNGSWMKLFRTRVTKCVILFKIKPQYMLIDFVYISYGRFQEHFAKQIAFMGALR